MKRHILSIFGLLIAAAIQAAPITSSQAAKNVRAFLSVQTTPGMMFSTGQLKMATPEQGIKPYYVFNIGENGGFVIASGDDAAYAILGYSRNGHFDVNNVPENMKSWLNKYAQEIESIKELNLPARKEAMTRSADERKTIPMLVTSQWNQLFPYNDQCPDYKDGNGKRPTGCVATAMAQVMYFHKWPQEATRPIEGYTYKDETAWGGDGSDKTLDGLEPTVFDWDNMTDKYGWSSSDEEIAAVAKLMNYVGHSVKMMYGVQASGAMSEDIAPALINIFGYKKTAKIVYRKNYPTEEGWENVMYEELSERRPILYSGVTEDGAGHQFVCDGYENGYFHINWGWGGMSDGMFKLTALDPYNQGTGGAGTGQSFSHHESAVIGVRKPVEDDNIIAKSIKIQCEEESNMKIEMKNYKENYTSLQFDMFLPEGVSLAKDGLGVEKVTFMQDRSENGDHVVSASKVSNGSYRFVIYSPTNSRITGTKGGLINLTLTASAAIADGEYTGEIKNVVVCNTKLAYSDFAGGEFKIKIEGNTGIEDITVEDDAEAVIYTLDGIRISDKVENLNKGIYIINGKKRVIK